MKKYISEGLFREIKDAYIYVERTLSGGRVRRGLIGAVDLECYDFSKGSKSAVRATEGTVAERIPPRVKIRKDAIIELPHVILLLNDEKREVIPSASKGEKIYDFELCGGGGHIRGYALCGEEAKAVTKRFVEYAKSAPDGLSLAVGDGNHSLATAKVCWEEIKKNLSPEEQKNHPARFCLAEVENIYDEALEFEPIHRVLFNAEKSEVIKKLKSFYPKTSNQAPGEHKITIVSKGEAEDFYINGSEAKLAVGAVQKFIDSFCFETDYIHGAEEVYKLSSKGANTGIILPKPEKSDLFKTVISDGALPRKTFSMGEAWEKRYYLEAKRIKKSE